MKLRGHCANCSSDFQELSALLNKWYRQPVFQKTLTCVNHRYLKTHWLQFLFMFQHCSIQRKENWKHCFSGCSNYTVRRVQQVLHTMYTMEHRYPAWNSNMCMDSTMPKNDWIAEVESIWQRSYRVTPCSKQGWTEHIAQYSVLAGFEYLQEEMLQTPSSLFH